MYSGSPLLRPERRVIQRFPRRKPKTTCRITPKGKKAFAAYLQALSDFIAPVEKKTGDEPTSRANISERKDHINNDSLCVMHVSAVVAQCFNVLLSGWLRRKGSRYSAVEVALDVVAPQRL